jgi:hypothetical protein
MIKPKQHPIKPENEQEHEHEHEQAQEQAQEQEQESGSGSGSYLEVIDPKDHSQITSTSSSSPTDPPGSPRSIISWHQSDLVSIPNSSQPTSDFDDRSDDDDHHNQERPDASSSSPIQTGEQPFNNHPHQTNHHHHLTAELLTAITDHLVMPRLPMIPSPSNQSSRPVSCRGRSSTSESAASLHHHRSSNNNNNNNTTNKHHQHFYRPTHFDPLISSKHPHLTQHPSNLHPYSLYPSRTLVVGEAQEALGIGPLKDLLSSSFLTSIDRTDDILPAFKVR